MFQSLKIATWNLERPKTVSRKNAAILEKLKEVNADILILTETNSCIDLGPEYVAFPSKELMPSKACAYVSVDIHDVVNVSTG